MSNQVSLNGSPFTVPANGEGNWGTWVNAQLRALCSSLAGILLFGNSSGPGSATTHYLKPGYVAAGSDSTEIKVPVPLAGKVSKLRIAATGAPSGVNGIQTFTVRKNGADTAVVATLLTDAIAADSGTASFTVAAGDLLSIKVASNGDISASAANITATLAFTPS